MRKFWIIIGAIALAIGNSLPARALTLPKSFETYANSPFLAKPGIIVLDPSQSKWAAVPPFHCFMPAMI